MKAIITVLSTDREGIIAQVSGMLYEHGVNILDISQTVLGTYFTMVMLVDLSKMKVSFKEMTGLLEKRGEELGMEIRMQRSEIFDAMHRV
ncbi:MAG: ACT domain-containing protein [Clostridia bacterium]|nr:ACT domain-containing protein [Clostridia bacterium]